MSPVTFEWVEIGRSRKTNSKAESTTRDEAERKTVRIKDGRRSQNIMSEKRDGAETSNTLHVGPIPSRSGPHLTTNPRGD